LNIQQHFIHLTFIPAFFAACCTSKAQTSSDTTIVSTTLYTSLCTSYTANKNWQGQDFQNIAFNSNILFKHNLSSNKLKHAHVIIADLGYLKFVDSIWTKSQDRIQLNLLWNSQQGRIKHSYSFSLNSQFMPNKRAVFNEEMNRIIETKVGGIFQPFSAEIGYGAVVNFWKKCNINFAFATINFSGYPRDFPSNKISDVHFASSHKNFYDMAYGLSLQTNIQKPIEKHLEWINNSRFFANQFDKNHVNFDLNNRFIIKIWKYLQVRLDTKISYNPLVNYHLQFSQEILFGLFYQKDSD
jgi:hypothetical protein